MEVVIEKLVDMTRAEMGGEESMMGCSPRDLCMETYSHN